MSSDNKRAILAVVLSGLILFGWQHFFAPKNVVSNTVPATETVAANTNNPAPITAPATGTVEKIEAPTTAQLLTDYTVRNQQNSFTINNQLQITAVASPKTSFSYIDTVGSPQAFSLEVEKNNLFHKIWINFTQLDEKTLEGASDELGLKVKLWLEENGKLNYIFTSTNAYKYRVVLSATKKELDGGHHREFTVLAKDLEKFAVGKSDEGEGEIKWLGIDFNFHLFSFIYKEKKLSVFNITEAGQLTAMLVNPTTTLEGSFVFAKKDYDLLTSLGDNLNQGIDYGMWAVFAIPILRALQFFYKFFPNYGVAIILLTLFIRLLTFPLQYKSFKSMKKMQDLQPELNKLKEKFKDDPQRMQKETMDLFKKSGANPLGGCLPLLLQMPIFFAFYKVLFNSTELMGAPFMLWIKDLSHKDPFYVLPVLMAGSMFLQQKMTPSPSADPTQQKIMMFMPLIFGLIMKDLPSGLTLYIFVSTIMGIGQQYFVYKRT